jgi:serine protease Do
MTTVAGTLRVPSLAYTLTILFVGLGLSGKSSAQSFAEVVDQTQPKIVKVFGAGGLRGLEAYQSGFLISGEGHSTRSGAMFSIARVTSI